MTTVTAGIESIRKLYLPMLDVEALRTRGILNAFITSTLLLCVIVILIGSVSRWAVLLRERSGSTPPVGT